MTNLEKALTLINSLQLPEFFTFMETQIGNDVALSQLQQTFILGKTDFDFYDRLKTFAQLKLGATHEKIEKEVKKESTIIQKAEKITNIVSITGDNHTFNF
jgi:hypothetical protein